MILGILASCGEQPNEQPASSVSPEPQSEEPGSETDTEEESGMEEPVTSKHETEYVAPEDGSFTICGTPLSEYSMVLYFPGTLEFQKMNRKDILDVLKGTTEDAFGSELNIKVIKNEKYNDQKWADHEILFGNNFHREGMPETDLQKNYYGVTADGTVYFSSPSPMLYRHLWRLFLEEFFGVPYGSGERSGGCTITECYRELPLFDIETLKAQGYELVFDDEFDGEEINRDLWTLNYGTDDDRDRALPKTMYLENGELVFVGSKLDDEGNTVWESAQLCTRDVFCRGYFEASIKVNRNVSRENYEYWSALWIYYPGVHTDEVSKGGIGGVEMDIMENFGPDCTTSCIWVAGAEGKEGLSNDLYEVHNIGFEYPEEYHVYSLLWEEDYYQLFVDGILIAYSNYSSGTSTMAEQLILSLIKHDPKGTEQEMRTQYVRIWQKPSQE